ncbi:MAG: histidine ammonia-lyase [Chloroflexi bacterium]|nr:MAG: histidine ammonia-lyase [Chloroflexota bacterium]
MEKLTESMMTLTHGEENSVVTLNGNTLTLPEVKRVLFEGVKAAASEESMLRVKNSHEAVRRIVSEEKVIYGINTGFGKFSDVRIDQGDVEDLQLNLIRSHACGVGEPFPESVSRAMLLLRANALLKGFSGVRPVVIETLLALVNNSIHPVIPQQGSLGASGDLAPLSHLALVLMGEGEVFYKGERKPALEVLVQEGIEPVTLQAKEGLALINGTQAMTAMGVIGYLEAEKIAYQSELIAALTMEGLNGIIDAFDENIHQARGYQQQVDTARRIREYLSGSSLITRQGEIRVQDAYSLRCHPQVIGAGRDTLGFATTVAERELASAIDNPVILPDGRVESVGNFHGEPLAFACDFLALAVAEAGAIAFSRIDRMLDARRSRGLPPFLSTDAGVNSGMMIAQYTAGALVAENRRLAHPASADSMATSAMQEDHVSLGWASARNLRQIIANTNRVLAVEAVCAAHAVELRAPLQPGRGGAAVHALVRSALPGPGPDRYLAPDLAAAEELVRSGQLLAAAEQAVGTFA